MSTYVSVCIYPFHVLPLCSLKLCGIWYQPKNTPLRPPSAPRALHSSFPTAAPNPKSQPTTSGYISTSAFKALGVGNRRYFPSPWGLGVHVSISKRAKSEGIGLDHRRQEDIYKELPRISGMVWAPDVSRQGLCLSWLTTQTSIYEMQAQVTKHCCSRRYCSRSILKTHVASQAKGYKTSVTPKLFLLKT